MTPADDGAEEDDTEAYMGVEALLDRKWVRKRKKSKPGWSYLVKWEDGGQSWVRDIDLNCPSLLKEFNEQHGLPEAPRRV